MIDVFNIPSNTQSTFTFYSAGVGVWQTWSKPRNAKMLQIFCLGAGASGANNNYQVNGTAGFGGTGGGSGAISRLLIPAFLLPDTLYIQPGLGGPRTTTPTAGGQNGIAGTATYVSLQPNTGTTNVILQANGGTGGGIAGGGGAGGTAITLASLAFSNLGMGTTSVGVTAGGGGNGGDGGSLTALATTIVTGGGGGGGKAATITSGKGGSIIASPYILTSTVLGGQSVGQSGAAGYGTFTPFCGTGGGGGSGNVSGLGAPGGDGWYGCGGGGGGCGNGSNSTTYGGRGGDGLVIITVIS
jgi:hypothetical protein